MISLQSKSVLGISICVVATACAQSFNFSKPDLVPESTIGIDGPVGFCNGDNNSLTVRVRNQTNNDALQQTVTRVTFSPSNTVVDRPTLPIPGGSFSDAGPFPIPTGCFNSDCTFTIAVDATDLIDESHGNTPDNHEANNVVQGICIG